MRQVPRKRSVGFFQANDYGCIIGRLYGSDLREASCLEARNFSREKARKRIADIVRRQGSPIVEADIFAQMEDISQRIGHLPAFRQPGLQAEVAVTTQETVEDQRSNPLRLGVGADARVQVQRRGFDQHDDGLQVPLRSATNPRQADQPDYNAKQQ